MTEITLTQMGLGDSVPAHGYTTGEDLTFAPSSPLMQIRGDCQPPQSMKVLQATDGKIDSLDLGSAPYGSKFAKGFTKT